MKKINVNPVTAKIIKAAGLSLDYANTAFAKIIWNIDKQVDTGYMYLGKFVDANTGLNDLENTLFACYVSYENGAKCATAVIIHKGQIYKAVSTHYGAKWASQMRPAMEALLDKLTSGNWMPDEDCHIDVTEPSSDSTPAVSTTVFDVLQKEGYFDAPVVAKPRVSREDRKDVMMVIRECYEGCPEMTLWEFLTESVGEKLGETISNDLLMELVFEYSMQRQSEKLAAL